MLIIYYLKNSAQETFYKQLLSLKTQEKVWRVYYLISCFDWVWTLSMQKSEWNFGWLAGILLLEHISGLST